LHHIKLKEAIKFIMHSKMLYEVDGTILSVLKLTLVV